MSADRRISATWLLGWHTWFGSASDDELRAMIHDAHEQGAPMLGEGSQFIEGARAAAEFPGW